MSRIAAAFRFLGGLGLFAIATPILLIWWAIYLFVATVIGIFLVALFRDYVLHLPLYANPSTFLDWIANIVIYGSAWCAATWLWADRSGVSLWFSDDAGDSHTHFLNSPRITNVISRSEFHFAELQRRTVSVFLVLPPNRLDAYPQAALLRRSRVPGSVCPARPVTGKNFSHARSIAAPCPLG